MNNYIAISDKGEVMNFKAVNAYESRHYLINYADCSQQWTVRTYKEWLGSLSK